MIIPPYPFTLEDPPNVPLEDTWYARPHLFFSCWFRPTGGRPPSQGNYTIGPDDFQMQLPARGPMDHATTKLYEPSPTPILFVAPLNNVLGRVPLFPLFLDGNATPTIPHHLRHLKASAFPHGAADAAKPEGRRGSNAYEVNTWLWQFGRGRERLGGLSVSETEDRREQVVSAGAKQGHETRRRREAARRGDK
jgi:hypothetical protein